jgi:hypothetical protein
MLSRRGAGERGAGPLTVLNVGKKPTIKPDDIVRTPSGRTARCRKINADGSRELEDTVSGELFDMRPEKLYLLRASRPKPWPSHRAPD